MSEPTSPWYDLDSYITTPRLGGLALSLDGGTLVCGVQGPDNDATGYVTSLWRVDVAGGRTATRLTRSVKGEAIAAFLRDGSLVFTSKRDVPAAGEDATTATTNALWCLPAGGGAAYVLARRDGGWGSVLTSPAATSAHAAARHGAPRCFCMFRFPRCVGIKAPHAGGTA